MDVFFPENLKSLNAWVLWRKEERDGRQTKVPYSSQYNGRASSTNPKTWSSFERAQKKYESSGDYNGLGVVISQDSGLIFMDVDHCFDTDGSVSDIGADVLELCQGKTFIERSQSGTGMHVLAFGTIPKSYKNSVNGTEMYDRGRFCALTGDALSVHEIAFLQPEISSLYEKYRTQEKAPVVHPRACHSVKKGDEWIIRKASEHGAFSSLYRGDWTGQYKSQSEADVALCGILAFWTNCDPEAIDRLFRTSGLYREKWEKRPDYRMRTIKNACSHIVETLDEYITRTAKEEARRMENVYSSEW